MIARTADETRNGWTPISTRRATALGASFVCNVEKTRWPVSEALMAMFAVSTSRISPIMDSFRDDRGVRTRESRHAIELRLLRVFP